MAAKPASRRKPDRKPWVRAAGTACVVRCAGDLRVMRGFDGVTYRSFCRGFVILPKLE